MTGLLREAYREKSILLTGGTGFLGTALVEKILRGLPEIRRLYLLVRASGEKGAAERFWKDVLGSSAFDVLRERLGGGFQGYIEEKVRVLEGDVHAPSLGLGDEELAELSREVDVVIHSAASVVFDAPLDAALASNVEGTLGLLRLARGWERAPTFVHISTAYVAGVRRGLVLEAPPEDVTPNGTPLDPVEELRRLEAEISRVEVDSRERGLVRRFETEAQRELGLVLVIVRPAIIESSYREPYPGWIQGSRMADPIIMAFAKGVLREFPGDPDSLVDLVPVDHVVNATLVAAVRRPEKPEVFQVASGERNPLRYRDLYNYVRGYFLENPLRDAGGRPIPVAEWSFPGRWAVERRLKAELAGLRAAGAVVSRLPEGHMVADLRGRIARAEKRARMSLYYSRIYGPYSTIESVFSTGRTADLFRSLPEEDREAFPFDITEVDWEGWLVGAHLPALTTRPNRRRRRRKAVERPGEVAAIFDVDGTLIGTNVVSYYAWLRLREMPPLLRPLWVAAFLLRVPYYWGLDKISRAHFNRAFYRNYRGWKAARARQLGRESFAGFTLDRLHPEALERLREHKRKGHRVILLSGALDFLLDPFRDLVDDVLCARLREEDGVYTGELSGAPVAGEARARMLASYARRRGIDLSRSYAYADSISDLPMLEAVGHPVAVNPDRRLERAAHERGWPVRRWDKAPAGG